jgi:NADPH:quinone reductase-like Zn-dependent oxidoreductase
MKAVRFHEYGGPDVLQYEDAPRPEPHRGEVLVRVHAAGVNPLDWKVREGHLRSALNHSLPLVPGWDFSGVVEAAGPEADLWQPGDAVFGRPDTGRDGAYAEYIVVRESEVARKPEGLDHLHAAGLSLAGLTAWQALFETAGLCPGQSLLIHGGAGGVGSFAVQLAKWKGAQVIATASAKHLEYLRGLGADEALDYETTAFEDKLRNLDVVLDLVGGDALHRSWKVLRPGGIIVSTVEQPSAADAAAHGVKGTLMRVTTKAGQLHELAELAVAGQLKINIETVLPLKEALRAQIISQQHHVSGKIILQVV